MYQPVLSRFQSLDPLIPNGVDLLDDNKWFGDRLTQMRNRFGYSGAAPGFTGYTYVRNNPLRFTDPSGLAPVPNPSFYPFVPGIMITNASVKGCLRAEYGVKFVVPPSHVVTNGQVVELVTSGWVVQEISLTTRVYDCDGADITHHYTRVPDLHFWEAFDVFGIRLRSNVPNPDDTYLFAADFSKTRGHRVVRGVAKGAGNVELPGDFTPGGIPEAGTHPTTSNKPYGWDHLPGAAHNMTVTWDCCCDPPSVTMHTEPSWAIDFPPRPGSNTPEQIPNPEIP